MVEVHENTADGEPNGNGAWNALVKYFETEDSTEIMTRSVEKALNSLKYSDSSSQSITGFLDQFNSLCYEHSKYCGDDRYTEKRKLRLFIEAMSNSTKYSNTMQMASALGWDLKTLQVQLRLVEVNETPFNHQSLFEVKQRRQELPRTEKRDKSSIPESFMLPKPVFFDLIKKKDAYSKYKDIVSNGSHSEAMNAKNRIIESWKSLIQGYHLGGVPLRIMMCLVILIIFLKAPPVMICASLMVI